MIEKGKITIDNLKEMKTKGENGEKKHLTFEEIRDYDREDILLDRIKNRDKVTLQDILIMDRMDEWKNGKNKTNTDVDEIIRKAQEPYIKQIEEMKRQQEKAEEERKWEKIQGQIDSLKELIINANTKKPSDDENPVMKELMALQKELKDEKETSRKKDEEAFRNSIKDMLYDVNDQISMLKNDESKKPKDKVSQIIELEKEKKELLNALGVKSNDKEDEASMLDVVDSIAEKVPKWAKTASTVREAFSKESEIPDDVPDEVPSSLPQRKTEISHRTSIPDDIQDFLNRGRDETKGYVDYSGTPWINLEGEPIMRKDIEDLALTNPEDVRRLMKDTESEYNKQQAKKKEEKARKSDDITVNHIHTSPAKPVENEPVATAPAETPSLEISSEKETDPIKEARDYLETGEDRQDDNGNTVWVGKKGEIYTTDDGKPASKNDLRGMMEDDPDGFMAVVREHLNSIGENNGE